MDQFLQGFPSELSKGEAMLQLRRFYHSLARSLEGGTSTRPRLPIELVKQILRTAHCVLPSPILLRSASKCEAYATSIDRVAETWMSTPPFQKKDIARISGMQLTALSRDQGWISDPRSGTYSWFEIAITTAENMPRMGPNGKELVWASHYNLIALKKLGWYTGIPFGPDHEVWTHLEEGDMIVVRVCAQYAEWRNIAEEGMLEFTEWFEPTLPPRIEQP